MNVCVAGWYFREPLMKTLESIVERYPVTMVAHREPFMFSGGTRGLSRISGVTFDFPTYVISNVGLEFHCYDCYLKSMWKGGDTFFTHDDNEFTPEALDEIAGMGNTCDQAFIFSSRAEAKTNGFGHGRAIFCSDRMMRKLRLDGGFPYDETNTGQVSPTVGAGNKHDAGIQAFMRYLGGLTNLKVLVPYVIEKGVKLGFRGKTGLRLNLGCGGLRFPGFVNIDMRPGPGVDRIADVRTLDYDQGSVDEVVMVHVIEHFTKPDAISILAKLHCLLKPGGSLVIESPDIGKCITTMAIDREAALHGIFGDGPINGDSEGRVHLWGWSGDSLSAELKRAGFRIAELADGNLHGRPWRDLRIVAVKPD